MKVILKKIKSNHNNLRTDVIEGFTRELPAVGEVFWIEGEALDSLVRDRGGVRLIRTSPVKTVTHEENTNLYLFTTENSEYSLEVLDG